MAAVAAVGAVVAVGAAATGEPATGTRERGPGDTGTGRGGLRGPGSTTPYLGEPDPGGGRWAGGCGVGGGCFNGAECAKLSRGTTRCRAPRGVGVRVLPAAGWSLVSRHGLTWGPRYRSLILNSFSRSFLRSTTTTTRRRFSLHHLSPDRSLAYPVHVTSSEHREGPLGCRRACVFLPLFCLLTDHTSCNSPDLLPLLSPHVDVQPFEHGQNSALFGAPRESFPPRRR